MNNNQERGLQAASTIELKAVVSTIDAIRLDLIIRKLDQARVELGVLPSGALPLDFRLNALNHIEHALTILSPAKTETIEA